MEGITGITVRRALSTDAEIIADISRQAFYEAFASFNTADNMEKFMSGPFSRENLLKEFSDARHIFFLALLDDKPVGYAKLTDGEAPVSLDAWRAIELSRIYALKEFTGKKIGQALMDNCIRFAKENNWQVIWLGVWENNLRAIKFYRQLGFEKFSEHIFMLGDDAQTDWLMRKIL